MKIIFILVFPSYRAEKWGGGGGGGGSFSRVKLVESGLCYGLGALKGIMFRVKLVEKGLCLGLSWLRKDYV